jgi:hypothetical protein
MEAPLSLVSLGSLDHSGYRLDPYGHQVVGIEAIVANAVFALFDEMGAGKTKQGIDGAQHLWVRDIIDRVLIVAPASVRGVWYDEEFGELAKHLWMDTNARVTEFHARLRSWDYGYQDRKAPKPPLTVMITNYEFIRSKNRLEQLLPFCTKKTLLICDESSALKSHKAQQTKAVLQLRKRCGRVLLLNGTPIANHPGDLYSQGNVMDPKILACSSWWAFRSRYAIMGGWQQKQIVGWRDIEDLQRRFAPYVLRRLKKDCLDLPAKLPTVVLSTPLSETTWDHYTAMRDEMVTWLSDSTVSQAPIAITKVMRLAQITSGYLGGVEEMDIQELEARDPFVETVEETTHEESRSPVKVIEVGREKLDAFLEWLEQRLESDPNLKLLVWSCFRPEILRAAAEVKAAYPSMAVGMIIGGQKRSEREHALRLLDPRSTPSGPVVVIGSESAGSMGLNLTASHTVYGLSTGYNLKTRLQRDDRTHRPGQISPVSYFDLIATGPKGQKTINHKILAALLKKENLATMTASAWIKAIKEE